MSDTPPDASIVITVTGREEHLAKFVRVCKVLDLLGAVGASRTVEVFFDGDGAARLSFDYGETDVSGVEVAEDELDEDTITVGFD